jgi:hypothetical protein
MDEILLVFAARSVFPKIRSFPPALNVAVSAVPILPASPWLTSAQLSAFLRAGVSRSFRSGVLFGHDHVMVLLRLQS